jgi:hypothetical protein
LDKVPFSVYDFFGYLASGFLLLVGLAAAFVGSDDWQKTPPVVVGVLLIVVAYSTGHIIANIAGYCIESKLVGKVLGRPSTVLFDTGRSTRLGPLFPGYFSPMPAAQQQRVLDKSRAAGIDETGDALFFHCWATVKADDAVLARLNTFLNLYGYCRNTCVSLLLVGAALLSGALIFSSAHTGNLVSPGWCACAALLGAVGLFYRYLKFFRQYSFEVFTSYAEHAAPVSGAT